MVSYELPHFWPIVAGVSVHAQQNFQAEAIEIEKSFR